MKNLEFPEFQELCSKGNVVPVYTSLLADMLTPVSAFLRLRSTSRKAFLLESVEGGEKTARYSFLGSDPFSVISYNGLEIIAERDGTLKHFAGNIFEHLSGLWNKFRPVRPEGLPRFTGGAVGYFGYETVSLIEDIPRNDDDDLDVPEGLIMLFDSVLVFDHLRHHIYAIVNVFLEPGRDLREQYDEAQKKIADLKRILRSEYRDAAESKSTGTPILSNFTQAGFMEAVSRIKHHIREGDVFQVVLSQKFRKQIQAAPFDIYRALRVINPSPYLYFLQHDDLAIIGSSPELLVRVDEGTVEVRPIAGTRPRGKTDEEDQRLAEELLADEKERAEHVMLVDLGRNDVGRVSNFGTVEVPEFMNVEKYSHVMHLVSDVKGKLRPDRTSLDALQACFPAGTVSGAPKVRAMEIISELEPSRRGIYAGALGYLDFSGNLDTCIAIRTIVTKGPTAYFQAGAGIVADSVPEREFAETEAKASAMKAAIELAEGGLL